VYYENMKKTNTKQRKIEYERIVKVVKNAEKTAEKFIQNNKFYTSRNQPKYL